MKKIFAVLLTVIMLTSAAAASEPIELPDIPIPHGDNTPECSVTVPDDFIYNVTLTVKSTSAKAFKEVFPNYADKLNGYKDNDKFYYLNVKLDDAQAEQIYNECGEYVYLCNIAFNGEMCGDVFEYENDKPIPYQFQMLMPDKPSVLTFDIFGQRKLTLNYQNDAIPAETYYMVPNSSVKLPYPETDGKTPESWNTKPDGTGDTVSAAVVYTPEAGKLWKKEDNEITLYAVWDNYVPVLVGDVNEDGEIDNKDVVVLFRLVTASSDPDYSYRCDVNEDGGVDNKDVTVLFRKISAT